MSLGSENEPQRYGNFGQILEKKLSFRTTMFWYALNCVDPSLS